MPNEKHTQKAGDNSTQVQADLVQIGIDEKRVREIIKEENKLALKEMSIIAEDTAIKRFDNYTNILVPKLVKAELLESFSDPSIQVLFKQSEKTAVCTEREKDYELLSELLIHRIKKNGNYTTSAAIEKAVDEVNNISDEALLGLTIVFSILTYSPITGNIKNGLSVLDDLYGKIIRNANLPNNFDWIDNLEIVGAIRRSSNSKFRRLEDYYFESHKAYSSIGIKKDSENYNKAIEILRNNNIPQNILIENELDNNYVVIDHFNLNSFDDLNLVIKQGNVELSQPFSSSQKQALNEVVNLYENNNSDKNKFTELLKSYKNINILLEWWNDNLTKLHFSITAIGRVIAHTNAKSIDSTLPDLD